jgi:hypothetical protein
LTAPNAAGERWLAAGDFLWLTDVANNLRSILERKPPKYLHVRLRMRW